VRGFFDPEVVNPPWKVRNTTPFLSASAKKNVDEEELVVLERREIRRRDLLDLAVRALHRQGQLPALEVEHVARDVRVGHRIVRDAELGHDAVDLALDTRFEVGHLSPSSGVAHVRR